ncbi:MAG: ComEC/Rec2 family competence protein [Fimbriimonas ginsengisoli]|uniref:ComEC/Rec2 family competence protein n=1 Tax=Fimbriimonas ginsengisoli TaxID=1005039 RepID=A0A931LSU7_FIMGI|nr:ComEC/Rec2 family competence protein [Fimbriimonas ginsengisoli]
MRKELERRPALLACLALALGVSAGFHPANALGLVPLLIAARLLPSRLILAAAFLVGLLRAPMPTLPVASIGSGDIRGTVVRYPVQRESGASALVRSGSGLVSVRYAGAIDLGLGDSIDARGRLRPPLPGQVGPSAVLDAYRLEVVSQGPWIWNVSEQLRNRFLAASAASGLGPEDAAWLDALCLGARETLDRATSANLTRTGTVHAVAASGLHVLILAMLLEGLLSLLAVPKILRVALVGIALLLYVGAVGLHPASVRAALTAVLFRCASLVRREPDLLSALGLSGCFILLVWPEEVFGLGFQLSTVVVGALGLTPFDPPERDLRPLSLLGSRLKSLARVSLIASLASLPILAQVLHEVSLVSVAANVLLVFVLPWILGAAMLGFVVSGALPALGAGLIAGIAAPLAGWGRLVVDGLGASPHATLAVPGFSGYWLVPIYLAAAALWRPHVRPA